MTARLPRPSRKLDAAGFYTEYVPQLWHALVGDLTDAHWLIRVGSKLESCAFGMIADGSTLKVIEDLPEHPHVTFVSDTDSFRIAMFDLLPQVLRHTEKQLGERSSADHVERYGATVNLDRLFALPGKIRVLYEDDAGDEANVVIVLGDGNGPEARVSATDSDLWALLEGGGGLAQLLRARVRIDGDIAYLLSVVAVIEPDATRPPPR